MDGGYLRLVMYYVAFLRGDTPLMQQQLAWGAGKPGEEDSLLSAQSDSEDYFGHRRKARDFSRRAVDSAVRAGSKETAAGEQADAALREAELGDAASAREDAAAALALAPGRDVKILAALAFARSGNVSQAAGLVAELEKTYLSNTVFKLYWLPTIKAAIALNRGNPAEALVPLEAAAPYDLGEPVPLQEGSMYPAYLRGEAYLASHQGKDAAAEYQKILDHRGVVVNFTTGALARLGLARAYAMEGDTAKARSAYQDFLALWKDADPDIPILKQAKAEYAKLQ